MTRDERNVIQLTVNDEPRELEPGSTVLDLLESIGARSKLVAVERNRELVPRARHGECTLEDGDVIEIVTLVGGG